MCDDVDAIVIVRGARFFLGVNNFIRSFHLSSSTLLVLHNIMMHSGNLLLTGLLAATSANAFVSTRLQAAQYVRPLALSNHNDDYRAVAPDFLRNAAAIFAVTCGLLIPSDSFAMNENAFQSSTMTVAEVIRTMDFSLPSSYDNIVDATASGKEELTVETVTPTATAAKKAAPQKKEAAPKKEKKEAEPKKVALTKAEREEAAAKAKEEKALADKERQKEIEAKIKADREARIAARKAAQEEKEAAEAAKAEEAYKGVTFVDTSMPKY